LQPTWYTGAYATILQDVIKGMMQQSMLGRLGGKAVAQEISTLVKMAIMDMDIALGAYFRAEEAKRKKVVDDLSHALEAMANGNMTHGLTDLPEDYAKLQADFEAMRRSVNAALNAVTSAVETISAGSAEIRSASDNLSTRTEHQAATVEETTAALNGLTNGISEAADGAGRVEASVSRRRKKRKRQRSGA
jgi:methyl-accepting chemotaxis protein